MVLLNPSSIALFLFLCTLGVMARFQPNLSHIPTIGPWSASLPLVGRVVAFFKHPMLIQQGYAKYRGNGIFKISDVINGWTVIVCGSKLINEVRLAPDDTLSFTAATDKVLQSKYIFGPAILDNPYHIAIVRGQLTRHLADFVPALRDEIVITFHEAVGNSNEWITLPALRATTYIVSGLTNRAFIGLPHSRHSQFRNLVIDFTMAVIKDAVFLSLFPEFLKPFVSRFATNARTSMKHGRDFLRPIIESRQQAMLQTVGSASTETCFEGDNDFLAWLMEKARGEAITVDGLTTRIFGMNFSAIHTSSVTFTHALYDLAAMPEYIKPLREEVETIVAEFGWTKSGLDKMLKVDSFLKESQRLNGVGCLSMMRTVLKPFRFSDGTSLPVGTSIAVPTMCTMVDEDIYGPTAHLFDGFRFFDQRHRDGRSDANLNLAAPSAEYLVWGYGKHACAGRFFAANLLKAMLAHVVLTYDIKLEVRGQRPKNLDYGPAPTPHPTAGVMFRMRQN